jgi:prepilin-type N-terminal cleavage/methylation domain-containing protein
MVKMLYLFYKKGKGGEMMNSKGFTLIELLAVIVILAIIALIATPIVLGIIEDASRGASERSAEYIIRNVELAYSSAYMKSYPGGSTAGSVPKINEVAQEFKMDGVVMNSDGSFTEAYEDIECTATTTGDFVVSCSIDGEVFATTGISMELLQ